MSGTGSLVSVVIPVFNGARFLAETLASAAGQTGTDVEIIVVDDGSRDGSAAVARSFSAARLIERPHGGAGAARNSGIEAARGDFIAFLDADDRWHRDKTARQAEALRADGQAGGAFCLFRNFIDPLYDPPPTVDPARFLREEAGRMPSLVTLLARRSAVERIGPFRTDLETGEDLDWLARAADRGISFLRMPEVLVERRLHDANLSYRAPADARHLLEIMRASIGRKRGAPGDGEKVR